MNINLHKIIASAALVATLSLAFPVATVQAEETQQTQALSPKVGNKLLELQTMVQNKNYQAAINQANNVLTWKNLTPYEKVQIYNFMAFANYNAGNTSAAMSAYEIQRLYRQSIDCLVWFLVRVLIFLYCVVKRAIKLNSIAVPQRI